MMRCRKRHHAAGRRLQRGYTLIEVMIALSVAGLVLTGALTALRAGLIAYGTSTEDAGRQASARLVMQRTLAMIRTARLHDPYDPSQPGLQLLDPDHANHPLRAVGIRLQTNDGHEVRVWWQANNGYGDADLGDLMMADVTTNQTEVVMQRVRCRRTESDEPFIFTLVSRTSPDGLLLARATFHLFAERDPDATTTLEQNTSSGTAIQMVSSTAPRQNLE